MKNTIYLILAFLVCQLSFSKVTVDPVMPALPNISFCDDNNDGMAIFNLSSQDTYIISGQSSIPSSYIVTYHLTSSDANSGTSAIATPASYLGSNGQVIYARIINIATGFFAVGSFSLIVNPPPSISNKTVSICNGSTFSVTPIDALPDIIPTGTTYTWSAPVYSSTNVTGGSAQSVGQSSISQSLVNTGTAVETAIYTVRATSPLTGCFSTFTITVVINSNPSIVSTTTIICSGGTFSISPTNILPNVVPTGTTYTWSAPVYSSTNISGGSAQAVPQTPIAQTLTNIGSTVETATYTVTATSNMPPNSCSSVFTITVTVNPKPIISNKSISICNGSTFNVTPTNTLPDVVPVGTTYTWPAPIISPASSIAGGYAQSSPQTSISQTLTNTTSSNATATYTVTATSGVAPNTCSSVFTITVTVKPTVSVTVPSNISICNGDLVPVTYFSSNLSGTTYSWTNSNPAIGISSSGTGNVPSFLGLNPLNAPISSTITVTPFNNGCLGMPSSYTITVLPSVNLPFFSNVVVCDSYTLPSLSVGNYFTGPNGTGTMMSAGTVITTTQTIYIHATNGTCTADESYMVIINPSIVPTFTAISPLCLNSPAPPLLTSSMNGISGTWTPSNINTTITGSYVYTFVPDPTITGQECAVSTTILVTVLPSVNPIITGTGDSNIVYVDYPTETVVQPLLLTATTSFSDALTYQWYLNGTAISGATNPTFLVDSFAIPDEPRSFSAIVTSVSSGCTGMSSFEVIQTAVPAPFGLSSQTFTPGQTLANLVVTGTNVLWYSTLVGRNTTSTPLPSNTLLVDGVTYYATQTINGYESPTRLAVTVHSTLSNVSFGIVDFKYSPNPVNDYLFIQAKETIKTIAVYNALGQLVLIQNGNTMELKLDLSQLKSGNYFVKIQSDLKQNSFKIIKK